MPVELPKGEHATSPKKRDIVENMEMLSNAEIEDSIKETALATVFDSLKLVEETEEKPVVLGEILNFFSKQGIGFGFRNERIILEGTHPRISSYQKYIDAGIRTNAFQVEDILKAFLYRTSDIAAYQGAKSFPHMGKYVIDLLSKYKVEYKGVTIEEQTGEVKFEKPDPKAYQIFREFLQKNISGKSDSEFLIMFFDDLLYHNGKYFLTATYIKDYSELAAKNQKKFGSLFEELNRWYSGEMEPSKTGDAPVQGVSRDVFTDPFKLGHHFITKGGAALMVVFGLLGRMFFGRRGGWVGAILGILMGFFRPSDIERFFKNAWGDTFGNKGLENKNPELARLLEKYKRKIVVQKPEDLQKDLLEEIFVMLLNDKEFLESDSTNINIFSKSYEEQEAFFQEIFGDTFVLNSVNKKYLSYIFESLRDFKKQEGIEPYEGVSMQNYLGEKIPGRKGQGEELEILQTATPGGQPQTPPVTPEGQLQTPPVTPERQLQTPPVTPEGQLQTPPVTPEGQPQTPPSETSSGQLPMTPIPTGVNLGNINL